MTFDELAFSNEDWAVEHLTCDGQPMFPCESVATTHRLEVNGWTVVEKHYCTSHAGDRLELRVATLQLLVVSAVGGWAVGYGLTETRLPGAAILAYLLFFGALGIAGLLIAWWHCPGAKAFEWPRLRAARRLLCTGTSSDVVRSADLLIGSVGRRLLPELRARLRKEFRDNEDAFIRLMAVINRADPAVARSEARELTEQLVVEARDPMGGFVQRLRHIDRAAPDWLRQADPVLTTELVTALVASLKGFACERESPDSFTPRKSEGSFWQWYEDEATPELYREERLRRKDLEDCVRLLETIVGVCGSALSPSVVQTLTAFPDLYVWGVIGFRKHASRDDRDEIGYSPEYPDFGVKAIVSSAALRSAAQRQIGVPTPRLVDPGATPDPALKAEPGR